MDYEEKKGSFLQSRRKKSLIVDDLNSKIYLEAGTGKYVPILQSY